MAGVVVVLADMARAVSCVVPFGTQFAASLHFDIVCHDDPAAVEGTNLKTMEREILLAREPANQTRAVVAATVTVGGWRGPLLAKQRPVEDRLEQPRWGGRSFFSSPFSPLDFRPRQN